MKQDPAPIHFAGGVDESQEGTLLETHMPAPQHVARVKQAIEERGIAQSQAALEIGCSSSTLSKWLRGLTDSQRLDIVVDAQAAVWLQSHGFLQSEEATAALSAVEEPKNFICHHCN